MCGIVGIISTGERAAVSAKHLQRLFARLLRLSEARGKEASGVAIKSSDHISVHKQAVTASTLVSGREYRDLMGRHFAKYPHPIALIGHSRLVTNGAETRQANNQPVSVAGLVGVHNGIIVNCDELYRHERLPRQLEVDSEVILRLLRQFSTQDISLPAATQRTFGRLRGVANIAVLFQDSDRLLLATNNGSLYMCVAPQRGLTFFASEEFVLRTAIRKEKLESVLGEYRLVQLQSHAAAILSLAGEGPSYFELPAPLPKEPGRGTGANAPVCCPESHGPEWLEREFLRNQRAISQLRRCSRCVHPETLPFVDFDSDGVCSYCRNSQPLVFRGRDELELLLREHRRGDGRPDCIVPLSGGRDSCYSLHFLTREMGMRPIAYTYDWGMVTDLARRNCSRMCSELGVEHIIVSADIKRKRRYIRKNVLAWLRRPALGTVPLFMAGDKQFFYYAEQLKRQTGIDLLVFAMNPLERTDFKHGFCGISGGGEGEHFFRLSARKNVQIALYYAREFLLNSAYINESLIDTIFAYFSYFLMPHRYTMFHDYMAWHEETVVSTLRDQYDWESDPGTPSTWRIGDGTASFYNYIYYTVGGFTENDTFRSFQVREGHITREQALAYLELENRPRYDAMTWYCETIGVDLRVALKRIHDIPKCYPT